MSREVFIDASAWIAVSDRRDKYYGEAEKRYKQLVGDRQTLVTTNLVVAEAYIVIRRTGGHAHAMRFLRSIRGSARLFKVYSDAELESLAEELLRKYTDQDFSFADAVSFAVMQARGIQEAFTFDSHFATMGFQMLPDRRDAC